MGADSELHWRRAEPLELAHDFAINRNFRKFRSTEK